MSSSDTSTELARERNREVAERTLMAWIRTALAMIGFGFGIGRLEDYLEATGRFVHSIASMRVVGASFMTLGMLALFAAIIQHVRLLRRIEKRDFVYLAPWPIGLITAILLLLIGIFGFMVLLL